LLTHRYLTDEYVLVFVETAQTDSKMFLPRSVNTAGCVSVAKIQFIGLFIAGLPSEHAQRAGVEHWLPTPPQLQQGVLKASPLHFPSVLQEGSVRDRSPQHELRTPPPPRFSVPDLLH